MVRDDRLSPPNADAAASAVTDATGRSVATVEPISKGINAIYRVTFADGERAVLKTATFNTAAELRPEPRLLDRLGRETSVPVPDVLAIVDDGGSLGVFHYLLEHRSGRQVRSLQNLPASAQDRLVEEVATLLARVHEYRVLETPGFLRVTGTGSETGFTTTDHDTWGEVLATLVDHIVPLFERVHEDGPFAGIVPDVVTAFEGIDDAIAPPETHVLLHRDCFLDNLLLGDDDETPLVRTLLDFGDPIVGDYRLDLAFAEDAILDVQRLPPERTTTLRDRFRTTYASERGLDPASIVDERYEYYRLLHRCRWAAVAIDDEASSDPETLRRYDAFFSDRLAALDASG
jgi:aminoglycoside phosphotransferase (APT) family kinase protein